MQLSQINNINISKQNYNYTLSKNKINLNFNGKLSDITDGFIRRKQDKIDEQAFFRDAKLSSINARRMLNNTLRNFEYNTDEALDKYSELKLTATHANPYFGADIDSDTLSINKLTGLPESYITYSDDEIILPLTGTKKAVKTPDKIVIGEDNKIKGITDKILYLNDEVAMENINNNGTSVKIDRIDIFDVKNCNMPIFQFLKRMWCDGAVLNNVRINYDGTISAKSLITYYRTKDNQLRVEDVYIHPEISQPSIDLSTKAHKKTRATIKSMYKVSTVGGLKYKNKDDYDFKTKIQGNSTEMYIPQSDEWRGNCDFYMEPVIGKSGRYKCKKQCITLDGESVRAQKTETLIF